MGDWGVGMPGSIKLGWFGRVVDEFFGHVPYLVGSATHTSKWRDVDVRLILPDEEFDAMFGALTRPRCLNLKWNAACLAFTALGRDMTGLPIDFQIDRQTEANEEYPGIRHALHNHKIAKRFADLQPRADLQGESDGWCELGHRFQAMECPSCAERVTGKPSSPDWWAWYRRRYNKPAAQLNDRAPEGESDG